MPGWFVIALLPLVISQVLRLNQHDASAWIFWDYAGRICALGVLAAIPSARRIAFRRQERRLPLWKVGLWIAGIVLACICLARLGKAIDTVFPMTALGGYPRLRGWLYAVDLTFGLV
jgi:hypothetical protein